MQPVSMPRPERNAVKLSVRSGGPEKRKRALREDCAGDQVSRRCGGAGIGAEGCTSVAAGRPGGCAASPFTGCAGAMLVAAGGTGRHGK
eukprot:5225826-Pleurochrysis_carterae.AAC.2